MRRILLIMPTLPPESMEAQSFRALGGRLKAARLAMNVPAADLADRVGISRSTLRAVEGGETSPSVVAYLVVISALGLSNELPSLIATPRAEVSRVRARRPEAFSATSEGRRQKHALAQGKAAIAELRKIGVKAELIGSVVWGQFHASSDVDFLIVDDGGVSDGVIYDKVASKLENPFDLVFLDRLRPASRDLILKQRAENGRAPISANNALS